MQNTADFLDALRAKLKLPSDGRLADYLGMHRQHVSHYRQLNGTFSDEMSLRIAEILELDGAYVMACMHHQRAKLPEVKAAWNHAAKMLGGVAATIAMLAILPHYLPQDNGVNALLVDITAGDDVYYVKHLLSAPLPAVLAWLTLIMALLVYPGASHDLQR